MTLKSSLEPPPEILNYFPFTARWTIRRQPLNQIRFHWDDSALSAFGLFGRQTDMFHVPPEIYTATAGVLPLPDEARQTSRRSATYVCCRGVKIANPEMPAPKTNQHCLPPDKRSNLPGCTAPVVMIPDSLIWLLPAAMLGLMLVSACRAPH